MPIKSREGQSLIELAMILPIFIAFWTAFLFFAQIFIVKIELLTTARHGIFWLAYNHDYDMTASQESQTVEQECRQFLQTQSRGIDLNRLTVNVDVGNRWEPIGPTGVGDLLQIFTLFTKFERLLKESVGLTTMRPARIRLEYKLPAPRLLRAIPGFPESLLLRGSCVCYR
jgi:hypothetical protein